MLTIIHHHWEEDSIFYQYYLWAVLTYHCKHSASASASWTSFRLLLKLPWLIFSLFHLAALSLVIISPETTISFLLKSSWPFFVYCTNNSSMSVVCLYQKLQRVTLLRLAWLGSRDHLILSSYDEMTNLKDVDMCYLLLWCSECFCIFIFACQQNIKHYAV